MKTRNKIIAGVAALALAVGAGLASQAINTQDSAEAHPSATFSALGGVGPLHVQFETLYESWMQPNWQFGPNVRGLKLYPGQCFWYTLEGTHGAKYYQCNYKTFDPNNPYANYNWFTAPPGLTIMSRYL